MLGKGSSPGYVWGPTTIFSSKRLKPKRNSLVTLAEKVWYSLKLASSKVIGRAVKKVAS